MIRLSQVKLPICHSKEDLKKKAAKALRISPEEIQEFSIVKQSIDARKREEITYSYVLDIKTLREERKKSGRKIPMRQLKRRLPTSFLLLVQNRFLYPRW